MDGLEMFCEVCVQKQKSKKVMQKNEELNIESK